MEKRLFRKEHPILMGLLIAGGIFLLFLFGITFFISMLFSQAKGDYLPKKDGIGIIEIKGVIFSPDEVIQNLAAFRKNEHVKGIVLRVDSPGGTVGASQEIFEEVKRTNKVKPVIASMGSIAASGGYYVSLGAEKIIASPGSLTGSMGVILKFANLAELYKKIGYQVEIIKSGQLKDIGASNRALTEKEKAVLQSMLDDVHDQFISAIATSRALPEEKIRALADGRVFSGQQAKEHGLIDDFGNLMDAVQMAGKLANYETDDPYLIYPVEKDFSLLRLLAGSKNQAVVDFLRNYNPGISYEWQM